MGRKSRFTDGDVHESVAELLRGEAVVSIQGISRAAGISVGSLYHRFGSRDGVLTACWLDAVGGG
jgi:AcrR family transcriptional regulator